MHCPGSICVMWPVGLVESHSANSSVFSISESISSKPASLASSSKSRCEAVFDARPRRINLGYVSMFLVWFSDAMDDDPDTYFLRVCYCEKKQKQKTTEKIFYLILEAGPGVFLQCCHKPLEENHQ